MKEELKRNRTILFLVGTASYYFLSIDVLSDLALIQVFGELPFLLLRAAYLLSMAAGFFSVSFLRKMFPEAAAANALFPAAAAAGTLFLSGTVFFRTPVLLALCVLASLFLAGFFGAAAYAKAAAALGRSASLGRLSALGMGIGSFLQVLTSVVPLPLAAYGAVLVLSLWLTVYLLQTSSVSSTFSENAVTGTAAGRITVLPRTQGELSAFLRTFLLITALVSFMGGLNDGELARLQSEGQVDLQAAPRLLYFAGMALGGTVFDRFHLRGLSLLVLFVMICSVAGALFMSIPATLSLNAGIYSLFAGVVIIFFTVPLFRLSSDPGIPGEGPSPLCDRDLLPSLGRIARLPALAAGMLFYELLLIKLPFMVTMVIYAVLAAALAVLFILSGLMQETGSLSASSAAPAVDGNEPEAQAKNESRAESPRDLNDAFQRFCLTYGLTARETEVLNLILRSDLPTTQLAGELHVAERTLYRHLSALYEKTGTDSRVGLLMKFYQFQK